MAKKRCKQNGKTFVYFRVIKSINSKNRLPKDKSRQYYSRYVKTLKINGLIERKGYGVWEITKLGREVLNLKDVNKTNLDTIVKPAIKKNKLSDSQTIKFVRSHGFMWQIKTPSFLLKSKLFKILEKKSFNPLINGNSQIQFYLWGHNIKLSNRSIIINFDKDTYYKSNTAKQGYKTAVYELERLIKRIESILNLNLKYKNGYKFKPCKKHFGNVNNEFAGYYNNKKTFVSILDKGKEWLLIDFSDNKFIELETVDNDRNIIDNDFVIAPFMNKLRNNPEIINKLESENKRLIQLIEDQQKIVSYLLEKDQKSINIDKFKY